jgi:hypothetical protein
LHGEADSVLTTFYSPVILECRLLLSALCGFLGILKLLNSVTNRVSKQQNFSAEICYPNRSICYYFIKGPPCSNELEFFCALGSATLNQTHKSFKRAEVTKKDVSCSLFRSAGRSPDDFRLRPKQPFGGLCHQPIGKKHCWGSGSRIH